MARRRSIKVKAKKKVPYNLVAEDSQPYRLMNTLVEEHHAHLRSAKIALAWRYGWKTDKDGRLKLGQCRKASDLDREFRPFDFIILLNHEAWNAADFSEKQMTAIIDHELCHAEPAKDDNTGEQKEDEKGRPVWRIRGHDLEEFREVVARNGLYKQDLANFAKTAMDASSDASLFKQSSKRANKTTEVEAAGRQLAGAVA